MNNVSIYLVIFSLSLILFFNSEATYSLIDAPGFYAYAGDVQFKSQMPGDNGVFITASNVIFDMGGHTIGQNSSNMFSGFDAIVIAPGLTNITIKNGTITNVTGCGIYVSDGCSEIYTDNLLVYACQETGILFDGSSSGTGIMNGTISNTTITSCTGVDGNPAYGLRLIETNNVIISDCIFSGNDAVLTNSGYGASIESCRNCEFINCRFNANGGDQFGVGISLLNSEDCALTGCSAIDNISHSSLISSTACGFLFNSSYSTACSNCKAIDNSNTNASSIGFFASDGSGNSFVDCVAQNHEGATAIGFLLAGSEENDSILNSQSGPNTASFDDGVSYGILIDGPQMCSLSGNVFSTNVGAQGYGFVDTTINTDNYTASNLSYANTTTGYLVVRTSGSFPVVYASVGDFSSISDVSKYLNIAIVSE